MPTVPLVPTRRAAAVAAAVALVATAFGAGSPAEAVGTGSISGRLTNATGTPLPDLEVTAWVQSGGAWTEGEPVDTGDDGRYVISGLDAGTYRVEMSDPFEDYSTQWWNRATSLETATDVGVSGQAVGGVDGVLGASPDALVNLSPPQVNGRPEYGAKLTAAPGTWSQSGATFTYDWYVTGRPKLGGSGPTFTLDEPADAGSKRLEVVLTVTATAPGLDPVEADAPAVRIGRDDDGASTSTGGRKKLDLRSAPRIAGKAAVGHRLVVRAGRVAPSASISVRWLRGSGPAPGASGATYRVTKADVGSRLRASVTYRRDGYPPLVVKTTPTAAVKAARAG